MPSENSSPDETCRTQFAEGPCAGTRLHSGDCTPNADDIALSPKPEAPECGWNPVQATTDCDFDRNCPVHGVPRPPFLVAYATGSGALNEIALPGEASVAVVDGSLVISHASGVLGIAHVKPLEMQ